MSPASGTAAPFSHLQKAFSKALQLLLQDKSQYQSVMIETGPGGDEKSEIGKSYWHPDGTRLIDDPLSQPKLSGMEARLFSLPSIQIWCEECQSGAVFRADIPRCRSVQGQSPTEQSFLLSYQCQDCKKRNVTFLVTRRADTLELSGRDPLETPKAPASLPRAISRYYSEAQVAHHTGQALAALCLMRQFIEQFWLKLPEIQMALSLDPRLRLDEIADIYEKGLPLEFKGEYPSLGRCHALLSGAIEGREGRPDVFEFCSSEILDHLDGRRFRRLAGSTASPFAEVHVGATRLAVI
ncbi:MAG TPA: hypothetical protein VFE25_08525 [Opitutaceae bacterium]|jgi:hypothetical protein|nr:hypothetical protein [Opitutaceae bacterium]